MVEAEARPVPGRVPCDVPEDMVVRPGRRAAQKVVVRQQVPGELAVAPIVIELERVPQRHEREYVVAFRRFKVQAKYKIDVVGGELGMWRRREAR